MPRENVTAFVPDTPVNAALRAALRFGGRIGHRFPVPARQVFRGPLLTALTWRAARTRPRPSAEERAALLPLFVEDLRRLERVTGISYADWAAIRPGDVSVGRPANGAAHCPGVAHRTEHTCPH